jgi:hypothetical protein
LAQNSIVHQKTWCTPGAVIAPIERYKMHQTIDNASQFRDAFGDAGRASQFSYDGLGALFDYFDDIDPSMELDVIAICCDYAECTPAEIARDYAVDVDGLTETETRDAVVDYLNEHSSVVAVLASGAVVYCSAF